MALVVAVAENGTMTMTVVLVVLMERMVKLLVLVVAALEKDREVQLVNLGKVLEHFMLAVVAAQVRLYVLLVEPVAAVMVQKSKRVM